MHEVCCDFVDYNGYESAPQRVADWIQWPELLYLTMRLTSLEVHAVKEGGKVRGGLQASLEIREADFYAKMGFTTWACSTPVSFASNP